MKTIGYLRNFDDLIEFFRAETPAFGHEVLS